MHNAMDVFGIQTQGGFFRVDIWAGAIGSGEAEYMICLKPLISLRMWKWLVLE